MRKEIELLARTREILEKTTHDLDEEKLRYIPTDFNNNILWHVGHVVVTQQLLCYQLSGLALHVDETTCGMFKKGSSPRDWLDGEDAEYESLIKLLHRLPAKLRKDYDNGLFQTFETYTTSNGFVLGSIEDAIVFNNFHEAVHLGYVIALKRAVEGSLDGIPF